MAQTKVTGGLISTTSNYEVGVITATKFVGPFGDSSDRGIGYFSSLDVTGNANIGGTLSYVDVDNITATGIITAQDSVQIGAGLSVAGISTFTSAIDANGALDVDGQTDLDVLNVSDLANFSSGVGIADSIFHIGDTNTAIRFPSADTFSVETAGSQRLRIKSNGYVGINSTGQYPLDVFEPTDNAGWVSISGENTGYDTGYLIRNGTTPKWYLLNDVNGTGSHAFEIRGDGNNSDRFFTLTQTGKIGINQDTPTSDLEVAGVVGTGATIFVNAPTHNTNVTSIAMLKLGYNHSGGQAVGYLKLTEGGNNSFDGNLTIGVPYNIGGGQFGTKDSVTIKHSSRVGLGTDEPLGIAHVNVGGGSTEPFVIERSGSGESIWSMKPYAGNLYFRGGPAVANYATDRFAIVFSTEASGGDVQFFGTAAGITSCSWDASANSLIFNDDVKAAFGNGSDFTIEHDGSHAYLNTGTGLFYSDSTNHILRNKAGTQDVAKFAEGASGCMLYCSNGVKLTTTTTGITVTGEVVASQDYPNIRPTLDFNFAAVKKLDPRISYYRTGPASYYDEFGIVRMVGDNTPRFDHDPTTRECKGFLLEESRTNYIKNSHGNGFKSQGAMGDYTSGWVQQNTSNSTITQFAAEGPDGTTSALKYTLNASSARRLDYEGLSTTNGTVYCFSWWMKRLHSGSVWSFQQVGGSGVTSTQILIDGVDASGQTSTYTPPDDEWHRVTWKFTKTTTETMDLGGYDSSGNTGDRWLLWGAQFEAGAYPTSYIPTNGKTVTRGNDNCRIIGQEFSDFYNQTEGTIVTEHSIATGVAAGDNTYVYQIDDGSDTNVGFRLLDHNSAHGDLLRAYGFVGGAWGSPQYGFDSATPAHDTFHKVALGVKNNDFGINFFGGTTATDTSGSISGNGDMTELTIGNHRGGTAPLQGYLRRFIYYPKKLTTNQLKTITS